MSYQLNKTDGTILVELVDGRLDTSSTNLTLVGRGYRGYGEVFNENFIKLLENFANTSAPSNPLRGQIWWDTANDKLNIWTGDQWRANAEPYVQATQPLDLLPGEFWYNSRDNQLFFTNNSSDPVLIGPSFTSSQGKSGLFVENILSAENQTFAIVKLFIANLAVGVFSNSEFTPAIENRIEELVSADNPLGIIFKGFNAFDKAQFKYIGTAENATKLEAPDGSLISADQFLRADQNSLMRGSLEIRNQNGLVFSTAGARYVNMRPQGENFFIENQLANSDIALRVRSQKFQGSIVNALYVDASEGRIGIFNRSRLPAYTLDVEGDIRVTGDLLVEGTNLITQTETVQIEDKNLEIGLVSSPTDTTAADGGIILKGTTDKTILWKQDTGSWTFSESINIDDAGNSLSINGSEKLSNNALTNIEFATDLKEIGTLEFLNVDNIGIDGNDISSSSNLQLTAADDIILTTTGPMQFASPRQIKNVATPTGVNDVTNKAYVDSEIELSPIVMTWDVTGLDTIPTFLLDLAEFIDDLYPANTANVGKVARLHTYSYSAVSYTVPSTIANVLVDANGTLNQQVVEAIAFQNIPFGNPNRKLEEFEVQLVDPGTGTPVPTWVHQSTLRDY